MRVAFYAPLKPPDHPVPSGDRRVARLLMRALEQGGHAVDLASRLRAFDPVGDPARQRATLDAGARVAAGLVRRHAAEPAARPDLFLTYHPYHKAPDGIGPPVARALGIPYVVAEASFAPKRAGGPWRVGHAAAGDAIRAADLVLTLAARDAPGLAPLVRPPAELRPLPPFLDAASFGAARDRERPAGPPTLLTVAMMRPGDKLRSYRLLAAALERLTDRPWRLLVAGDGPAEGEVRAAFAGWDGGRVRWLGRVAGGDLPVLLAGADLFLWPGLNEAYGMAYLEAQAAGLPVVACAQAGVAEVVAEGEGGRLAPADADAYAAAVRRLLDDPAGRRRLGAAGARRVAARHGIEAASRRLGDALDDARAIHARRSEPA